MLNSDMPCTVNDPATSNYIYITVITSVSSDKINEFKAYCYNKVLTIENSRGLTGKLSVVDITGREIISQKLSDETKTLIPVSNLTEGIYLVKVTSQNNQFSAKVLVN
jgi:Zn-dependent M28 family amino/carboxypeptidase